jgi:[ribosomal protein S18]-alanine N-acetyltransferase
LPPVPPAFYAGRMSDRRVPSPRTRRATCTDLDALLALEHTTFDHDRISRVQFRRQLRSASVRILVAPRTGPVQASAVVFFRRGSSAARLYSVAVSADARSRGFGAALLESAEREALRRGCREMRLEVGVDNRAAIALYEGRGYRRSARVARFYEDGTDAWRYAKVLPSAGTPR